MRSLLLLTTLLLAGCATTEVPEPALGAASDDLQAQLAEPSRLMAAAALLHATTDAYPATPYDLLGSMPAAQASAREVRLSTLALSPGGDTLRALYVLAPSQADPTERVGGFALTRTAPGAYTADFRLDRRADQTERPLPVATSGSVQVRQARGTLRIDTQQLRETLAARGAVPAPFVPGAGITYTFSKAGTADEVGVVTLEPIPADG